MISRKLHVVLFSILLLTLNCKEEVFLNKNNYSPILTVDGMITNEPGPYIIKLSMSKPLDAYGKIPYQNCIVTIYENSGISEELEEIEPGIYASKEDGIRGEIGNKYSISIISPEGKEYNSDYQELLEPIEIQSFYSKFIYLEDLDYAPYGLPGHQFYVDTKLASNPNSYLLWTMIETYKYNADYILYSVFDGHDMLYVHLNELPEYENIYYCWKTQNVKFVFAGRTGNLDIPKITKQPLHFVGTDSRRLMDRYSIILNQYSIGKEAYDYWNDIEKQISDENIIATSQPHNIYGNVLNVNNPNELVYGFFTVASVNKKRIYVDRPRTPFYYEICYVDWDGSALPPPLFYVLYDQAIGGLGEVLEPCIDCRSKHGVTVKPDFWIDK